MHLHNVEIDLIILQRLKRIKWQQQLHTVVFKLISDMYSTLIFHVHTPSNLQFHSGNPMLISNFIPTYHTGIYVSHG